MDRTVPALNNSMAGPIKEYDVGCYIACQTPTDSESLYDHTFGHSAALAQPARLSVPSMPAGMLSDLNECSLPNTPMSMTNASTFDGTMSRTASLGGHFDMLRLDSSTSSVSNTEDLHFSDYTLSSVKSNDLTDNARSHLVRGVGFGSYFEDDTLSMPLYPTYMSATSSSQSQQSHSQLGPIAEVHESTAMDVPSSNIFSDRDIVAQQYPTVSPHSCQLAPNQRPRTRDLQAQSVNQAGQHIPHLVDIASADGQTTRSVASIPRTVYKRPAKEKQYCTKCNDHPDGFRGDHELMRHMQRQHSTTRKCWIAVDKSEDGKWLSNCKHCRNKKKYYAYYNLAAHLRRIHFNKKEKSGRGRRRRGAPIPEAEKKGGKSGGDQPSIDWLKDNGWIIEVDEYVSNDSPDPVDNMDDEEDPCSDDYNMQFDQSITQYQPAYADANWQPSCGNLDLTSQSYLVNNLAMTPDESNFVNTYSTAGTVYGQDSYPNLSIPQQGYPTAALSQVYMQH